MPRHLLIDATGNREVNRTLWPQRSEGAERVGGTAIRFLGSLIEAHRLPAPVLPETRGTSVREEGISRARESGIAAVEREAGTRSLRQIAGRISHAAAAAGMTRRTFHRLLAEEEISQCQFTAAGCWGPHPAWGIWGSRSSRSDRACRARRRGPVRGGAG